MDKKAARSKSGAGIFIAPKSDIAFKEMMRCEEVRRHFISDVLEIPPEEIRSVRLENPFLSRRGYREKQCILDVRMLLNDNSRINVNYRSGGWLTGTSAACFICQRCIRRTCSQARDMTG